MKNDSSESSADLIRYSTLNSGFSAARDRFYMELDSALDPSFMLKCPEFDSHDFVDHCHLGDVGQRKLAKFIFNSIFHQ